MSPKEADSLLAGKGCPSCSGKIECQRQEECSFCPLYQLESNYDGSCRAKEFKRPERAVISAAMMEVLGDDLDGVASMLEDFNV